MARTRRPPSASAAGPRPLVVHIAPCYVDLERETGGVANTVRAFALRAAENGWDSLLLCGDTELGKKAGIPGLRRRGPGLEQEVFAQHPNPMLGPSGPLLERLGRIRGPHVCHIHTIFSRFTEEAMAHCAAKGVPFILTPHGKTFRAFMRNRGLVKRLWLRLYGSRRINRASVIALYSEMEAETFGELGITAPHRIMPQGFSLPAEFAAAKRARKDAILFLGYLDPRKQPAFLVRAFALSRASRRFTLILAGPDSYGHKAVVEEAIRSCGAEGKVVLFGPAYGADKAALMRRAACFCLPSLGEGMSASLMEAMGAGIPALVSKECNFRYAAEAGAAVELDGFDAERWARALDQILLSPGAGARMSKAALALASKYTWPKVAERWHGLYREVLSGRGPWT